MLCALWRAASAVDAHERIEWEGHRRSRLPAWHSAPANASIRHEAEVVVIGTGIAGVSTALFLARAGCDALVVERSEPNALASGGNADSLHAQFLSFDHGAHTLPLQRDAIALWAELQRDLDADNVMVR